MISHVANALLYLIDDCRGGRSTAYGYDVYVPHGIGRYVDSLRIDTAAAHKRECMCS
jgi:hypothetical protein